MSVSCRAGSPGQRRSSRGGVRARALCWTIGRLAPPRRRGDGKGFDSAWHGDLVESRSARHARTLELLHGSFTTQSGTGGGRICRRGIPDPPQPRAIAVAGARRMTGHADPSITPPNARSVRAVGVATGVVGFQLWPGVECTSNDVRNVAWPASRDGRRAAARS